MLYTLLSFDLSADSTQEVIRMVLRNGITVNDMNVLMKMATNLVPMYRSHVAETYLAWINAMYN